VSNSTINVIKYTNRKYYKRGDGYFNLRELADFIKSGMALEVVSKDGVRLTRTTLKAIVNQLDYNEKDLLDMVKAGKL